MWSSPIFIILYVDELAIKGESLHDIKDMKTKLPDKFEMWDMDEIH